MVTGMQSLVLTLIFTGLWTRVSAAETSFFLVGDQPGQIVRNESFVLPLSKPDDIDYARHLISISVLGYVEGDRTIVVADVFANRNDINRNYLEPKFPKWSWQVADFIVFAEIVAEGIIFSPTALEGMEWSRPSTNRLTVGFDGLFVIRELGSEPLYLSIIDGGKNLEFYSSGVGTNYVYALEWTESSPIPNWSAVPGASWPLRTNHWTLPLANVPSGFFRVKAESSSE